MHLFVSLKLTLTAELCKHEVNLAIVNGADLEFCPEVNAGLDGDALVDSLLADVAASVRRHFDIGFEDADVLELDSSTPQKFSR